MKYLILLVMLTSCSTAQTVKPVEQQKQPISKGTVKTFMDFFEQRD